VVVVVLHVLLGDGPAAMSLQTFLLLLVLLVLLPLQLPLLLPLSLQRPPFLLMLLLPELVVA
jgi:hypothetical protein